MPSAFGRLPSARLRAGWVGNAVLLKKRAESRDARLSGPRPQLRSRARSRSKCSRVIETVRQSLTAWIELVSEPRRRTPRADVARRYEHPTAATLIRLRGRATYRSIALVYRSLPLWRASTLLNRGSRPQLEAALISVTEKPGSAARELCHNPPGSTSLRAIEHYQRTVKATPALKSLAVLLWRTCPRLSTMTYTEYVPAFAPTRDIVRVSLTD